jgi:nucleotide-binding universal stress UspA family protein
MDSFTLLILFYVIASTLQPLLQARLLRMQRIASIGGLLVRSVSQKVVALAPCTVMVVP